MQRYQYRGPHNVSHIYADLVAALPALLPAANAGGLPVSPLTVDSDGVTLTLTFPNGIDAVKVAAVVAKSDPTASPATPSVRQQIRDALSAASTLADLKAALLKMIDAGV